MKIPHNPVNPARWTDIAEKALRDFGAASLADARRLLPSWAHYGELSEREVRVVLARFTD